MAAPKRFFAQNISDDMTLSDAETRHAKTALRRSEGDELPLVAGRGKEYYAIVTKVGREGVSVHVVRWRNTPCLCRRRG